MNTETRRLNCPLETLFTNFYGPYLEVIISKMLLSIEILYVRIQFHYAFIDRASKCMEFENFAEITDSYN